MKAEKRQWLWMLWGLWAFCLMPAWCQAQDTGIVVTHLRTSQPAVLGRYATVECTLKNAGTQDVVLKAVSVALQEADGHPTNFAVSPPNPPLGPPLQPGQDYTFRQFQQMNTPGDFTCIVRAQDAEGQWTRLTVCGRPSGDCDPPRRSPGAFPKSPFR